MLNDFTRKTVFKAKWLFKVICFDVYEKLLGDYHRPLKLSTDGVSQRPARTNQPR